MADDLFAPSEGGELPLEAHRAIEGLRERGPDQQSLQRMRAHLGIPDPSGGGDGGDGGKPEVGAADPATGTGAGTLGRAATMSAGAKLLIAAGGAALVGGLVWTAASYRSSDATPDTTDPPVSVVSASPAASAAPPPAKSAAPTTSAEAFQRAKPPLPRSAPSPKPTAKPGPSEVALIGRAQQLVRSQPKAALALCREHTRRFPDGMLAQEREVLIVEALQRIGREDEARDRSRSFLENNPDTAHKEKLEHLTGDASAP